MVLHMYTGLKQCGSGMVLHWYTLLKYCKSGNRFYIGLLDIVGVEIGFTLVYSTF